MIISAFLQLFCCSWKREKFDFVFFFLEKLYQRVDLTFSSIFSRLDLPTKLENKEPLSLSLYSSGILLLLFLFLIPKVTMPSEWQIRNVWKDFLFFFSFDFWWPEHNSSSYSMGRHRYWPVGRRSSVFDTGKTNLKICKNCAKKKYSGNRKFKNTTR